MSGPKRVVSVIEVWCSGSWIGFHCWEQAPAISAFLRSLHRHKFLWKAWFTVSHGDREIEFLDMQRQIDFAIQVRSKDPQTQRWSCEHWAAWIAEAFGAHRVEVSEDGENGAIVTMEAS